MQIQCLKCKGRGYCGRSFCPTIAKSNAMFKVRDDLDKSEFHGSSPAPFIGHHGYPYLNIGYDFHLYKRYKAHYPSFYILSFHL